MEEKSKYLEGTQAVLIQSQQEDKPYSVIVLGKEFTVFPNVFSPKYFYDSEFFAKEIEVEKNERFLEIGPGSGVVSVWMAMKGANVTAVDINPDAVRNTKENAKLHNLENRITVFEGSLYEPLDQDSQFDTIFWNTPFGYVEDDNISVLQKAVYDPGYRSTETFIRDAKNYLVPEGRLLIGFSSTLGHMDKLNELLKENGYNTTLLKQITSEETHPVYFELFEAKLINN